MTDVYINICDAHNYFVFSDIFDAMFLVKHSINEIVIQQGL